MDKLKRISQVAFIIGALFAVGSIGYSYYLRQTSPPGFCPLNPAKPLMWVGLVMLVLSLLMDGYMGYKSKSTNEK